MFEFIEIVYVTLIQWVLYGKNYHPVITLGRMFNYYAEPMFLIMLGCFAICGISVIVAGFVDIDTLNKGERC